ncbi:uncharacterized protein LOC105219245 isoform X2 [Zeugodacus cucurbitae]|uniref:Fuseless n=1 Tax=Zeugodacus cucurbitae TaxID=28588 RepID=A0A0A1X3P2_ZEUCU|nr:uncharacterized protein LOC105219245 isoform X2 [Zeugodacus cucurbitae]XP_011193549.1 uncharacterized protein LOC105219245 isoform X2 [Zeugodacus cucurbitae]XP_011193551.1 uncharacterized protein LOC105219245 isoform X2 [Zeugodacus cucurbitae]XP_011193552.1 uncharacterized protein LOC105219245 isoform X2 [Zeugodacus cucurbitae]XP_011193553.1 uncharacterized protein LOC105219245 isoform X2 [Zeugodacus cucurbitae]XP_054082675.1 uncharacterized protein LOC105219245 isoform X2 [Zeugodacus cucur
MMLSGEGSTSSISKKKSQQSNNIVNLRPKKKIKSLHELFLEILDAVLSCVIVAPCVIAYWRGTWELMGVLLFPRSMPLSALMSFLIGLSGHFFFTITQSFFRSYIHPDKRRLTYYVISRSYTALFGIVCVNMWRGSWILCDWLTSADSLIIIAAVTLVSLMFLIATRTVRNLSAAPYAVTMDHKSDYFDVDTMFKIPGFHQPGLYVLDTLFSVLVIGTLVVIVWRGVWGIMDITFYPFDKTKSSWSSLILGYITVVITFVIRPIIRCICKKIDGICKLIICDVFYFLIFFGAVNAWRGIWNLLDIYLYPDNKILSYWLTHLIPFLVLAALKCSNSILVRGVFIDAEGTPDECVTIPINYIKLHFERERKKKSIYICHQTDMMKKANKDAQINLIEKSEKAEIKIQAGRDAAGHV